MAVGSPYGDGVNGTNSGRVQVYEWNSTHWIQRGQDIDGEAAYDLSGYSVSLSSDGRVLAAGAYNNTGENGPSSGHVRIYEWNSTAWVQRGEDIDGEANGDQSGVAVSISANGSVVAIGAHRNDGVNGSDSGHVRVYEWNLTEWVQRGEDIDGKHVQGMSGISVSLSSDGTVVAIGAPFAHGNVSFSGHTRVYEWVSTTWIQRGEDINGEATNDQSGWRVSLSSDGTLVAISARLNDVNETGSNKGHVRIYKWDSTAWVQQGEDIDGENRNGYSGMSLSLSPVGTIVAIGTPFIDDSNRGGVKVYEWNSVAWIHVGAAIIGGPEEFSGVSVSLSSNGSRLATGNPYNDENGNNAGSVRVYRIEASVSQSSTTLPETTTTLSPETTTAQEPSTTASTPLADDEDTTQILIIAGGVAGGVAILGAGIFIGIHYMWPTLAFF